MENGTKNTRLEKLDKFIWGNLFILALTQIFSLGLTQIVVILATIAYGYKSYLKPDYKLLLTFLDYAVILFFLTRLISIPVSVDFWVSFGSLKKTPFYIMTYFVLSRSLEDLDEKSVQKLFQVFIVSAILVSIYASAKYVMGIETRVRSTTSGYTTLAIFLSATFAFTLGAGFYFDLFKQKIIWWSALILMLLCLALTFARAQWIAAFAAIFVIGIMKNKKILPITLGLVVILVLVSPKIRERAFTLANPMKNSSERTTIWKGAAQVFPQRFWLGHGIGSFHHIFPFKAEMKDKKIGRWHNDYIQAYMESGIFGLLIFLNLIFFIFRQGLAAYKKYGSENRFISQGLTFGVLLALLTFFVQGVASGFLGDPISSILFWIFVGVLSYLTRVAEGEIV